MAIFGLAGRAARYDIFPVWGEPYENAVAERVNGILKDEFGLGDPLPSFAQAASLVARAVRAYNE